jgi:hypothetical protein
MVDAGKLSGDSYLITKCQVLKVHVQTSLNFIKKIQMIKKIILLGVVTTLFLNANAGVLPLGTNQTTQWVESTLCTVVLRAPIDAGKPLQSGNPIEAMASLPVVCTGSIMQQMPIAGGVRQMMTMGFRVTGISHQVTPIKSDADGKNELLITALFTMERASTNSTR